ncbi:MAG TPA: glycosyltransferase family 2 protein [Steroidobacteraceae bacterium]|nr:glycosyltransferase family 2 protein [Steroidobacteraceae bacterium]
MPETCAAVNHARIIVPVRNGGERWREAANALRAALPDPSLVAVVDSASTDGSDRVASESGFELVRIDPRTFNHGATRQMAVDRFCPGREFVVFLTHDAVLEEPEGLAALLGTFADPAVGVAYGRQLPHRGAKPFEAHMVLFNYGASSETRSLADAARLGIKAAYISNSFGAYRISALRSCGGFPSHLILGEDTCVAVKMLLSGWKVRYCAEARVRHSHDYGILQETQRYFDFGVLHAQLPELTRHFGSAEGEGARFVASELRYILACAPWLLPVAPVRNAAKYAGYRLGRMFARLPPGVCRRLSMTKVFWDRFTPAGT